MQTARPSRSISAHERIVVAVVQAAAGHRIRAQVEADGAFRGRASGFLDRQIDGLDREHRGPAQPLRRRPAVLGAPAVVGAAAGRKQLGVAELAAEQLAADGGIQDLHVDALAVHVLEPRLGAEARLARVLEALHSLRQRRQEVGRRERVLALLGRERLALDRDGLARAHLLEPWRALPEALVDPLPPEAGGFHLVTVGVQGSASCAGVGHGGTSRGSLHPTPRRSGARRFRRAARRSRGRPGPASGRGPPRRCARPRARACRASRGKPRYSSIIAAESSVAVGLMVPSPTRSGAVPCADSK